MRSSLTRREAHTDHLKGDADFPKAELDHRTAQVIAEQGVSDKQMEDADRSEADVVFSQGDTSFRKDGHWIKKRTPTAAKTTS
jgi:hypothetical protein